MSSPWAEHKVVPDVITSEPPKQLSVSWGDVACNFQALTPTDMQKEPTIDFNFEKGKLYTIILTDPDAPSRADPKFGQWLHWLRVNVSNESAGDCLAQYVGAGPPQGTGLHRYVFLVYKQAGKCDAAKLTTHHCADQRPKWNAEAFVASLDGCSLEAGTFCQAEWDDYVPKLYKALETMGKNTVRSKRWLPLESNPELMNKYIHSLGVPEKFELHEIYGVDEALLAMVPQPVYAVLMLFPISEASERHKAEEAKQSRTVSEEVYFIEQEIANACGTIGLIHAVLNNHGVLNLDPGKFFGKFLAQTKDVDMATRVRSLNENTDIEEEHQALASEATSVIERKINANLHFNAFVKVAGDLYELDGRKKQPINHGKCENLLFDAANVVKSFMARDPNEIRWNLVALGPKE